MVDNWLWVDWLMDIIMVCGLWLISSITSVEFGVMSFPFVCDFGLEAVVVVGYVLDVLDAAVGKSHRVGAMHVLTVRFLRVAEIGARVVVLDSVVEGVRLGFLKYNVENNPIINAF